MQFVRCARKLSATLVAQAELVRTGVVAADKHTAGGRRLADGESSIRALNKCVVILILWQHALNDQTHGDVLEHLPHTTREEGGAKAV